MKEYTVLSTSGSAIGSGGGTSSDSVDLDDPGQENNYALLVKGDIPDVDLDLDVVVPGDTEQYDTTVSLSTLDLTNGGKMRNEGDVAGLECLSAAETVHVTVTNNDAAAGDATVIILQYGDGW